MGSKASEGESDWLPSLAALAHFHYYPLTETSMALCINSLKAPLFSGLSNTFSVLEDVIVATVWQKASHQVNQIIRANDDNSGSGCDGCACLHVHTKTHKFYIFPFSIQYICVRECCMGRCRRAEEADGNVFFSKQERLLNPCLLVASWCRGFRYMDGLRRFPSFIKCGHRMQPDAELILQKKQGGRATTSLVSLSYKSPASAAALRGTGVTYPTLLQPQQSKVTGHSHSHYEWVMWQCKNILYTSSTIVGHSQHSYDKCASFKCGVIDKWNAVQLEAEFLQLHPPLVIIFKV